MGRLLLVIVTVIRLATVNAQDDIIKQDESELQSKAIEEEKGKSELNIGGGLGMSFNMLYKDELTTSQSSINFNPSFNFSVFGSGKVVGFSTGVEYLFSRSTRTGENYFDNYNYTNLQHVHQLALPIKLALKTRGTTAFYFEIGIRPTIYFGEFRSTTNNDTGENYSEKYKHSGIRFVATNLLGVRTKFNDSLNVILGITNEWIYQDELYTIGVKAVLTGLIK